MIINCILYTFFFPVFIVYSLEMRDVFLKDMEKVIIFILLSLSLVSSLILIGRTYDFYKIIYVFPFLLLISITDIREKYVFDVDIFGGIIVSMGVFVIYSLNSLYFDFEIKQIVLNKFIISSLLFLASLIIYWFGGMGMGDVLLFFLVGFSMGGEAREFILGFDEIFFIESFNLRYCLIFSSLVFILSFITATPYCIKKLITKDYGDGMIPFTPFISIGFILVNVILYNI